MLFAEILNRLGLIKRGGYPRIVTVTGLVPEGVRFEVENGVEVFRVEEFGGEEEFTRRILASVQEGSVLFDIGACVGLVSLHGAKKGARVYAFEPDPYYRSRLRNNLSLNDLDGVTIVEWAVSDAKGKALFFTDGAGGNSPSLRQTGGRGEVHVETDTIDNAVQTGVLPPPDVVKIDIEGAEILALRGMRQLLASQHAPKTIFMEIHPGFLRTFDSSSEEVIAYVESFGYRTALVAECHDQLHCVFTKDS